MNKKYRENKQKKFAYTYIENKKGGKYMEYAKDEIFNIKYNETLDRLELKNKKWTNRIKIRSYNIIIIILILLIFLSSIDFYLIYSFMKILTQTG